MSLVELLVGLALSLMVGVAVVSLSLSSSKGLAFLLHHGDMQSRSRHALDVLSRDIRQCVALQDYATNKLVLLNPKGQLLKFEYSPESRQLIRSEGTDQRVLLSGCNRLEFTLYKRTGQSGTLAHQIESDPAKAKVINASWDCSRSIFGVRVSTERVNGARIVMRRD